MPIASPGRGRPPIRWWPRRTALARSRLAGLRVVGIDNRSKSIRLADLRLTRELVIVEVYADVDAADPDATAAVAPPWSTAPWPVLAMMDYRQDARFTRDLTGLPVDVDGLVTGGLKRIEPPPLGAL
jgi:hypothetical protein